MNTTSPTQDILPTNNTEWGFWGTSVHSGYDVKLTWATASAFLIHEFDLTPEQARDVLDARFGRHLADDLSFIKGGPTDAAAITRHLTERVIEKSWRKSFENAIRDVTGKSYPHKVPKTKNEIFTQIAQRVAKQEIRETGMNKRRQERVDVYYSGKEQIVATMMQIANRINNPSPEERKAPEQIIAGDITKLRQAYYKLREMADILGIDTPAMEI